MAEETATERQVRARRGADVPILAVTASAFAENRERCLRAGMNGYVAKPLCRDRLQAMASVVSGRDSRSAWQYRESTCPKR